MLRAVMLSVIMLSLVKLSVIMLSVVILILVMLRVLAPENDRLKYRPDIVHEDLVGGELVLDRRLREVDLFQFDAGSLRQEVR